MRWRIAVFAQVAVWHLLTWRYVIAVAALASAVVAAATFASAFRAVLRCAILGWCAGVTPRCSHRSLVGQGDVLLSRVAWWALDVALAALTTFAARTFTAPAFTWFTCFACFACFAR